MKKSELKEMIRQAMLAEVNPIKEQEEEEVADEIEVEDTETDTETDIEMSSPELEGDNQEILNNLEAALKAARKMGDEKLINQIGNTITFYTRAHIVKEEDLFETKRMQRLAGIIK